MLLTPVSLYSPQAPLENTKCLLTVHWVCTYLKHMAIVIALLACAPFQSDCLLNHLLCVTIYVKAHLRLRELKATFCLLVNLSSTSYSQYCLSQLVVMGRGGSNFLAIGHAQLFVEFQAYIPRIPFICIDIYVCCECPSDSDKA